MKSYPDLYAESPRAFLRKLEEDIKAIEARLARLDKLAIGGVGDLLGEYERLSLLVEQKAYGVAELEAWRWSPTGGIKVANLYPVEELADGRTFRWSGPEPVTDFMAPVNRDEPLQLRIAFMKTIEPAMLAAIEIVVDGVAVSHLVGDQYILATIAPRTPAVAKPTRVSISTGTTATPGEDDGRKLGIALFSVELAPVKQETSDA